MSTCIIYHVFDFSFVSPGFAFLVQAKYKDRDFLVKIWHWFLLDRFSFISAEIKKKDKSDDLQSANEQRKSKRVYE